MVDPYAVLGLPRDATLDEIRAAFHAIAKAEHPDKSRLPSTSASTRFLEAQAAWEALRDAGSRRQLDAELNQARPRLLVTQVLAADDVAWSDAELQFFTGCRCGEVVWLGPAHPPTASNGGGGGAAEVVECPSCSLRYEAPHAVLLHGSGST